MTSLSASRAAIAAISLVLALAAGSLGPAAPPGQVPATGSPAAKATS
jgi:hypothetical protein